MLCRRSRLLVLKLKKNIVKSLQYDRMQSVLEPLFFIIYGAICFLFLYSYNSLVRLDIHVPGSIGSQLPYRTFSTYMWGVGVLQVTCGWRSCCPRGRISTSGSPSTLWTSSIRSQTRKTSLYTRVVDPSTLNLDPNSWSGVWPSTQLGSWSWSRVILPVYIFFKQILKIILEDKKFLKLKSFL